MLRTEFQTLFRHKGHLRDAMKKDIHPEYFPEAKVLYRGEEVMTVGATVPELKVEIQVEAAK